MKKIVRTSLAQPNRPRFVLCSVSSSVFSGQVV